MVEVGTWSLPQKFTPKKKPQSEKNSTVSDRACDSISDTVEFFDLLIFSSGEILQKNFC
jgi:hypothetical protein